MGTVWSLTLDANTPTPSAGLPSAATAVAANLVSFIEIPAPASQGIRITAVDFTSLTGASGATAITSSQAYGKTTDLTASGFSGSVFLMQLIQATATGTFPNSSATPEPLNADGATVSTLVSTANIKWGIATAEGTVAANAWLTKRWSSVLLDSGILRVLPPGREIWVPKNTFFRVRAVTVSTVYLGCFNIEWEE